MTDWRSIPEWQQEGLLPFDTDADQGDGQAITPVADAVLSRPVFRYIGTGLTLDRFETYVSAYNFGPIPPDFAVLHHTAVPSTLQARYPTGAVWDAGEAGMTEEAMYNKRGRQLVAIRDYYRDQRGWDRGPHLFIDDRYIWLFTPMFEVGIHAGNGNSYRTDGRLHYSIGIEVIGYYEQDRWPAAVERLVGGAVAILQKRLNTFRLDYVRGAGGISSHRDWGKPRCPGRAITESYYLDVIRRAAERQSVPGYTADSPILGEPKTSRERVSAYITSRPTGGYSATDVANVIVPGYWSQSVVVGIDPVLAIAQMLFETANLTSWWSQRPRRNPAGIGVTGRTQSRRPSSGEWARRGVGGWAEGLSFATWEFDAIPAHIGRLLAYALTDAQANGPQQTAITRALRYRALPPVYRGVARTLSGLDGRWAVPGTGYGAKVAAIAEAMRVYRG